MSSVMNPAVGGARSNTPLETLIASAIRQFGDASSGAINGDVSLMMVEFANEIIEQIRVHPYQTYTDDNNVVHTVIKDLRYYTHHTEKRDIPDTILVKGLLARYAMQQGSKRAQALWGVGLQTLNSVMFNRWSEAQGMGGNDFENARVFDGGSNPSYGNELPNDGR